MSLPPAAAAALRRLKRWLTQDAYPIWWTAGADRVGGGFFDRLRLDGTPADVPKRLRVQARQAYAYALAGKLGWTGPAEAASRHGLDLVRASRQADGLYRLGAAAGDAPLDGMGTLYDQAFVLLALATHKAAFGGAELEAEAVALRERLADFAHPLGGFAEAPGLAAPLFANPNMHLFESCLAWAEISDDPAWRSLADALGEFALTHLIDRQTGALGEVFGADWTAATRAEDRIVWPGHLFEWAWLMMRWRPGDPDCLAATRKLVAIGERRGVDPVRNVAIFALRADLDPLDRGARLWAQTERIKALALAAGIAGDEGLWAAAGEACEGLEAFLEAPTAGLWRDWMAADGAFRDEPAPASSFYHIVCAIAELERLAGAG
ncbi:MAG: AGE family epimerase/isomerase [Caulobacterales bacterium]